MFEITIHDGRGGRVERLVLDNLPLPDGTLAHRLPQSDLYKQLEVLNVPNIAVHMGTQQLLIAYARHLKSAAHDKTSYEVTP